MKARLELHKILCDILGSEYVYFQPPETKKMVYPCIVYSLNNIKTDYANNTPFLHNKKYTVIVIDKDPDSSIPDKLLSLPMCRFDRTYKADNLNHWVFNLYF